MRAQFTQTILEILRFPLVYKATHLTSDPLSVYNRLEVHMCKFLLILSMSFMLISYAETPVFDDPVYIEANGIPINVGYGGNASPFVIDWDEDGKQDLLLGQFNLGRVRFYTNTGANYDPTFGDFVYLQADGVPVSVSYG